MTRAREVKGPSLSMANHLVDLGLLPPFAYRGSVLLGQQLRALCLETELEKTKKKSGLSISLSVPLDKGDRVGKGVGWADCL